MHFVLIQGSGALGDGHSLGPISDPLGKAEMQYRWLFPRSGALVGTYPLGFMYGYGRLQSSEALGGTYSLESFSDPPGKAEMLWAVSRLGGTCGHLLAGVYFGPPVGFCFVPLLSSEYRRAAPSVKNDWAAYRDRMQADLPLRSISA